MRETGADCGSTPGRATPVHAGRPPACTWRLPGSLLVSMLLLALCCQSSLAISQRGHLYSGSFGIEASEGGLDEAAGVAVSEGDGDVYVVDRGLSRIDRFDGRHDFLEAWGWGVADGEARYERCSHDCRPGLPGHGKYQLEGADAIAVDNSGNGGDPSVGDVYVEINTSEEHGAVAKFGPEGEPLGLIRHVHGEAFEELHGLAVGPDGALWVYDEEAIYVFGDGEPNRPCPEAGPKSLPPCPGFPSLSAEFEGQPLYGLALDGSGHFYVGHEALSDSGQLIDSISQQTLQSGEGEPQLHDSIEELEHERATAVAAEPAGLADPAAGDVFLDNGSAVSVLDASGELVQRLAPPGGLSNGAGIALDAASGQVLVADAGAAQVDVFSLEGEGPPSIGSLSAQDVGGESAQLDATVDPTGAATAYSFRIAPGHVPGPGEPCAGSCRELPSPQGQLPGVFGDQAVSVEVGGLAPGTSYRYRVLAGNEAGGHAGTVESGEAVFSTRSGGETVADARDWELVSPPLGGAAEPPTAAGGAIQAAAAGGALAYVASSPSGEAEGARSFEVTQMLATRSSGGWTARDIDTPNEHGNGLKLGSPPEYELFSPDLALALVAPFPDGGRLAEPPLAPPLSPAEAGRQEKTIYLRDDAPVLPSPGQGPYSEAGIYAQAAANGQAMDNPGYLALVTAADDTAASAFGRELEFLDATPDLTHVVIESKVALTEGSAAGNNLYEWSEGGLHLINVLPGPSRTPAVEAELGYQDHELRGAVSTDGSRVFWSDGGHLYMTDTVSGESLQLDEVQGGSGSGIADAVFQAASVHGTRVFFTDQQRLTLGSGAGPGRPDLYVCDISERRGALHCSVTDLTPSSEGESANVQGLVLGAAEDGSDVYFVADGVLSGTSRQGAVPGQCRKQQQAGAGCNLYVEHFNELLSEPRWEASWIGRLSGQDAPDWRPPGLADDLGQLTARVSPNGRWLAFMSQEAEGLVGYDNHDAGSEAGGALDEEVFLYDAGSGRLLCASCDPSGARPRGVLDPPGAGENPEGIGLLVDRPQTWRGRWLAGSVPGWTRLDHVHALYQSRYLSDSGRLFFESPADLVAAATNHKEDVYEYEPLGVPAGSHACSSAGASYDSAAAGCLGLISSGVSTRESAFLDAAEAGGEGPHGEALSEGAGDVYFITAQRLVPQLADSGFAVYDAHECIGSSPCLEPPAPGAEACASLEACRGGSSSTLPAIEVQTLHSGASGNEPGQGVKGTTSSRPKLTRAQKLRRALAGCRRRHRRGRRRSSCEARARHAYGTRTARKASQPGRRP